MNCLFFGCTIFRGNQVIKKHFQAQHKAVEKDRTVGKRFSLSQNFYVHKTFTFSNMSHSQNQRSSLQYLQYVAVIHHYRHWRDSREEMVHFFLSRAGELNFHFSRCSRMSRFWRKNSRSPLEIRDFEKNSLSLLERMRFCKQILFLFSILHSMSFPILVRNHILLFGLILTISVLQKGKVF